MHLLQSSIPSTLFAALVAITHATVLPAQNLVRNGHFDNGVAQWTLVPPDAPASLEFDSPDASGHLDSGSLRLELIPDGVYQIVEAHQCVPIVGGKLYRFGAELALIVKCPRGASRPCS